jgi:SAM-dependent methyltransferase
VSTAQVYWPAFLRELEAEERAWNNRNVRYPREDAVPWLPFPRGQFIALLADAVQAAPARASYMNPDVFLTPKFLDVGAGTGSKIRLAQALFGLDGYGIELVPELARDARARDVQIEVADAFDWTGYGEADIVYVNRPSTQMQKLESTVMQGMASGAVLMLVNGQCDPEQQGWELVSREWGEPVHGVWIKP